MERFYSTLGIDNAIKEQERDNIKANNMLNSTKTWQEEFDKEFCDNGPIGEHDSIKNFISKVIDKTREEVKLETIKEVEYEINKFYTIRCKNCSPAWFINETLNKIKLSLNNLKQ